MKKEEVAKKIKEADQQKMAVTMLHEGEAKKSPQLRSSPKLKPSEMLPREKIDAPSHHEKAL